MLDKIKIRAAVPSDCLWISRLMKELSDMENIPMGSNCTKESLEHVAFGDQPIIYLLVAEQIDGEERNIKFDDKIVGYVMYYITYSTWEGKTAFMEDLYISPDWRRKGLGAALWRAATKEALERGCCRWNFTALDWNTNALTFYEKHGAEDTTVAEGWHFFRMFLPEMKEFSSALCSLPENVVVRPAAVTDCAEIRSFIQELAEYEKMPDRPQLTVQILEKDGFGADPVFHCLMAESGGNVVGYVLFYFTFTWDGLTVYMEDIYVSPKHRGQGIGTQLWRSVVKSGLERQCSRCEFVVLNWNKKSIDFYKNKGATDVSEKQGFRYLRMVESVMKIFVKS